MEQLWIPTGEGNSEYIEKKSRFLGLVLPVTTEAEARAQLEAVKKREYDARHNCWAYVLHTGQKRYIGGILLGAGGLCRAYTKAAKDALDDAGISELRPWSVLRLDCPYALFERVKLEADKRGGLVRDADYGAQIALTILLPEPEEAAFRKALQELSAGSLAPETTGTELRGVRIR